MRLLIYRDRGAIEVHQTAHEVFICSESNSAYLGPDFRTRLQRNHHGHQLDLVLLGIPLPLTEEQSFSPFNFVVYQYFRRLGAT